MKSQYKSMKFHRWN